MPEHHKETRNGAMAQIQHYWHVVLKWKWTALISFILIGGGATLFSYLATPIYTSTGRIWIEDEPNILPFEEIKTLGAANSLQSQARLLESRALAAEVIEKLKLNENPAFIGKTARNKHGQDPADPNFREQLITNFIKSISVTPILGTQLVDVRFSLRDPKLASTTLDALFNGFIDMIVRKRFITSEKAAEFLDTQLAALRADIEDREKKLNALGSQKNIFPLTSAETPTVAKLAQLNKSLTEATIERIDKYNYYVQIKSAPLGEIPNVPADSLYQNLHRQFTTLSHDYAKRLVAVRPEYPEMQRLKSQVDAAKEALQTETQNLVRKAYLDFETAQRMEQSLQQLLNDNKNDAYRVSSDSVLYNSQQDELENKKMLLQTLSKRQSETTVSSRLKGLEAINVWVVDRADYPLRPTFPKKSRIILIGLLIGLIGGAGLAIGLESQTQTIKTSKDVWDSTGLRTIGIIPAFESNGNLSEFTRLINIIRGGGVFPKGQDHGERKIKGSGTQPKDSSPPNSSVKENAKHRIELIAAREPRSIQAESYRSIRTTLLVSAPPFRTQVILFTSALAREGKSSTISNLAVALAAGDKKVVVVDSDFRKPKQNMIFDSHNGRSLTQYILDPQIGVTDLLKSTSYPNLSLVTCGPPQSSSIELLTSARMEELIKSLRSQFDYILLDAPPVLAVSDALAMGAVIDGVILVVRGGLTPMAALKQAKQKLDAHNLFCLGVILNGADLIEQDGYYARQYYHYAERG